MHFGSRAQENPVPLTSYRLQQSDTISSLSLCWASRTRGGIIWVLNLNALPSALGTSSGWFSGVVAVIFPDCGSQGLPPRCLRGSDSWKREPGCQGATHTLSCGGEASVFGGPVPRLSAPKGQGHCPVCPWFPALPRGALALGGRSVWGHSGRGTMRPV